MNTTTLGRGRAAGWVFFLCAIFGICPGSYAGKGRMKPDKTVELHLYLTRANTSDTLIYDTGDSTKVAYWLNEASKKLWIATQGNLRIGTVYVYNRTNGGKTTADMLFEMGAESASARVNGLGGEGRMLFRMPYTSGSFDIPDRFIQNSLVHEFGHYGFGLYDEYLGRIRWSKPILYTNGEVSAVYVKNPRPANNDSYYEDYWGWNGGGDFLMTQGRIFYSAWSLINASPTASYWTSGIMNLDWAANCARYSWDGDYPYNKMTKCVFPYKNLPGHEMPLANIKAKTGAILLRAGTYWVATEQEEKNRESCWATIARKLDVLNPTVEPTMDFAGAQFIPKIKMLMMVDRARAQLAMDSSASMAGYRLEQAKEGAKLFTNLASMATAGDAGDYLGVVDFDNAVEVAAEIWELRDGSNLADTLTAIDRLTANGTASIAGALDLSRQQIESLGEPGAAEAIILLTDGADDPAAWADSVLPAVIERGIAVYTISLGDSADIATMQSIADQTHGKHFIVKNSAGLPAAYASINKEFQEEDAVVNVGSVLAPGAELSQGVSINQGATEAEFVMTSDTAGVALKLRSPSGVVYDESSSGGGVEFRTSGTSRIIKVSNPESGVWTSSVAAPVAGNGTTLGKAENPPVAIPDGSGSLERAITVIGNGTISSISPSISIQHPFIGDLKVTLKSPNGTKVVLQDRTGSSQNLQGTYGEDLTPAGSLLPLIGQSMKGKWTLTVEDNRAGDAGVLSSWGLTFNAPQTQPVAAFELLASVRDEEIMVSSSIEKADLQYPDSAVLHADVYAGGPVAGADVQAIITHPDGETQSVVRLYDNGNPDVGDAGVGDGTYSGKFAGFTQNGIYNVKTVVNCSKGLVILAGNGATDTPEPPVPATQFTREDSSQFIVAGVPYAESNAVHVESLALNRNQAGIGAFTMKGYFNAGSWQYDPKKDDFSLVLGGYNLSVPASQFKQRGRAFEFAYIDPDNKKLTRKVTINPYAGGTSKCTFKVTVENDNLSGISYSGQEPEITFSLSAGSISDSAGLSVMTKAGAKGDSASYTASANSEVSPALYIDTASVRQNPNKANGDSLQLLAELTGWTLPADLSAAGVSVEFGGVAYAFAAGALVKQPNSGYKATLDGKDITLSIKPGGKTIQLIANNQRLGAFANPAVVKVTIGAEAQVARLSMSYNPKSKTYSY